MTSVEPLPPLTPGEDQDLMQTRWATSYRWEQIEEETLVELGLTRSSYVALLFLRHGPMRSGRLAELVRMTSGGMAKMLSRLEGLRFVERHRGFSKDLRIVEVAITNLGSEAVAKMSTQLVDILRTDLVVAGISRPEVNAMRSVWRKVGELDVADLDSAST